MGNSFHKARNLYVKRMSYSASLKDSRLHSLKRRREPKLGSQIEEWLEFASVKSRFARLFAYSVIKP